MSSLKKLKQNIYQTLSIRKGNVYQYLSDEENQWLIEEATKLDRCDIGLVIAAIVKDAYAEEVNGENS
tara:strand:- start:301 stop:504 length:204 start_codon:yes stop_codon:yes gene_type:complete